ncbi:MAG: hypothetical protein C5B55_00025 [Blastocatellia bacterium]|nr:MAG: hypothetical protein C5B55_00025 [Blastocatellia bacterium]
MRAIGSVVLIVAFTLSTLAQSGGHVLFGDIKVDESQATGSTTATFQVLLYAESGNLQMRQTVGANGRYRFLDLRNGRYEVVVEFENREIARISVTVQSPYKTDFRRDIELQWKSDTRVSKPGVVSATEYYPRSSDHQNLLKHSREAASRKDYDQAITLLRQIVDADDSDYPAWEELGTNFFIVKSYFEAESCYFKAVELRPKYVTALINLGRVRIVQKNLDGAIQALERAVTIQPTSAEAQYFLGDAYLQAKLGSKAVPHLNSAIKLDPAGMADAHLLLAALYDAKGMKSEAAAEYTAFLKQRPDYPDRKKLEAFIAATKSRQ